VYYVPRHVLLGLKMKAEGIRGQGNGLSQKLASRKGLAADVSGVALSEVGTHSRPKSALICVNQRLKILCLCDLVVKKSVFSA
jgi:hypothetical protein